MSQHILNTVCQGRPVRVMLGWDRPLQYFFLLVEALDEEWAAEHDSSIETDVNGFVYCNLDDDSVPETVDEQLTYFSGRLVELGIAVPESVVTNVEADRRNNVGNRQVMYQPDGSHRDVF
jgi:hypothetical protein